MAEKRQEFSAVTRAHVKMGSKFLAQPTFPLRRSTRGQEPEVLPLKPCGGHLCTSTRARDMGSYQLCGKDLKNARRKLGLNQTDFGRSIGVSRHTVSYWECKPIIASRQFWPTVGQICSALGLPHFRGSNARARGWGFTDAQQEALDRQIEKELERLRQRQQVRDAKQRVVCGAQTRKGTPCRMKSEPGKRRCKFHGGLSTGPRTALGRQRIAEAQRKRWEVSRAKKTTKAIF